jgi:hypothetical protein
VLLQGRENPKWETQAFGQDVAHIARRPAAVRLRLRGAPAGNELVIEAAVEWLDPALAGVSLFVAAYAVTAAAGGNRLAYAWQGPLPLSRASPDILRRVPVVPGKRPDQSGVAAFVLDRNTGEVLQALTLPPCPG